MLGTDCRPAAAGYSPVVHHRVASSATITNKSFTEVAATVAAGALMAARSGRLCRSAAAARATPGPVRLSPGGIAICPLRVLNAPPARLLASIAGRLVAAGGRRLGLVRARAPEAAAGRGQRGPAISGCIARRRPQTSLPVAVNLH